MNGRLVLGLVALAAVGVALSGGAGGAGQVDPNMPPEVRKELEALLSEPHSDLELEIAGAMLDDAGYHASADRVRAKRKSSSKPRARIKFPKGASWSV